MARTRATSPADDFEREFQQTMGLIAQDQVPFDPLVETLGSLEVLGIQLLGAQASKRVDLASNVHEAYMCALEANEEGRVEPPLEQPIIDLYRGKVVVYAALMDGGNTKPAKGPTDTQAIPTSKAK